MDLNSESDLPEMIHLAADERDILMREEFGVYLKGLLKAGERPEKKFVIFGRGRSGSTLLVRLLNSHPDIHCDGELLHDKVAFPMLYVQSKAVYSEKPVYGFKLLSYQLVSVQDMRKPTHFLKDLHERGYRVIYLRRENLLYHALSNIGARRRGRFHQRVGDRYLEQEKMHVDVKEVLKWMRGSDHLRKLEEEILKETPHLSLTYESHLSVHENHQTTFDKICRFLNLKTSSVSADLVKLMPRKLEEIVENCEELCDSLRNTEYGWYIR